MGLELLLGWVAGGHNGRMVPSSVIMTLLVAATALVDVAIYLFVVSRPSGQMELRFLLAGAGLGQAVVLSLWIVFGRASLAWRILALVSFACVYAGADAWIVVLCLDLGDDQLYRWQVIRAQFAVFSLLPIMMTLTVMAAACHWAGMDIAAPTRAVEPQCDVPPRWQFTVRNLFAWITATALVLTFLRWTIHVDSFGRLRGIWWIVAGAIPFGLAAGLAIVVVAWSLLGTRRLAARVVVLAAGLAIVAYYDYGAWSRDRTMFFHLQAVGWAMALLAVTRIAGYRMSWRTPRWIGRFLRTDSPRR